MTLSITSPVTTQRVGPGVQVQIHTTVGPTAVDDVFSCFVRSPGGSDIFCYGDAIAHGFTTGLVVLGRSFIFPPATAFSAALNGLTDNATIDLNAFLSHANGSVVEQVTVSGFKWDAVSGLWWLVAQNGASGGPLTEILDAVRIRKTTPGQV